MAIALSVNQLATCAEIFRKAASANPGNRSSTDKLALVRDRICDEVATDLRGLVAKAKMASGNEPSSHDPDFVVVEPELIDLDMAASLIRDILLMAPQSQH